MHVANGIFPALKEPDAVFSIAQHHIAVGPAADIIVDQDRERFTSSGWSSSPI
jgi:hypothetical protein